MQWTSNIPRLFSSDILRVDVSQIAPEGKTWVVFCEFKAAKPSTSVAPYTNINLT